VLSSRSTVIEVFALILCVGNHNTFPNQTYTDKLFCYKNIPIISCVTVLRDVRGEWLIFTQKTGWASSHSGFDVERKILALPS
jgi:hypothetical protein